MMSLTREHKGEVRGRRIQLASLAYESILTSQIDHRVFSCSCLEMLSFCYNVHPLILGITQSLLQAANGSYLLQSLAASPIQDKEEIKGETDNSYQLCRRVWYRIG